MFRIGTPPRNIGLTPWPYETFDPLGMQRDISTSVGGGRRQMWTVRGPLGRFSASAKEEKPAQMSRAQPAKEISVHSRGYED
jgi:hypothetical protein